MKKADADALDRQEKKRTQKIGNYRHISFWQSQRNWLLLSPLYEQLLIICPEEKQGRVNSLTDSLKIKPVTWGLSARIKYSQTAFSLSGEI